MRMKLTPAQLRDLQHLAGLHKRFPEKRNFRSRLIGTKTAQSLRYLALAGLVDIDRKKAAYLYAITDAGLSASKGGWIGGAA